MKENPNEGMTKVYWVTLVTIMVFIALGAVLWWYDAYYLHEGHL